MSVSVRHVSLTEQAGAVDRARRVVSGVARVSPRAIERDYDCEALDAALRTLNWLRAHEGEIRAAIARPRRPSDEAAPERDQDLPEREEKRRFDEMPLGTQSALRCRAAAFQKFIGAGDSQTAAAAVRRECGVDSRAQFDRDNEAAKRWRALDGRFRAWLECVDDATGADAREGAT
jgi:hypothetical protein